jgi:prepilin-type N-terminal cleavage/methylation domain-containing protein
MRNEHNGFTVVEMMMVLAIGSILAAFSIPLLKTSMDGSNANSAAQLVAQQLNLARAMAIGTHSSVLVRFDSTANSVVIAPGTSSVRGPFVLPGKMRFRTEAPNHDTPDTLGGTVLGTGTRTQLTFLDSGAAATDASGTSLSSGTVFIENSVGDEATIRAVTLIGGTGRARIWQYFPDTTSWK